MNTTTLDMPNLGLNPDIEQRASAVLRAMGWSVADALRLLLMRIAAEGRMPFDDAAVQAAEEARAEEVKANWAEFLKGEPVEADFLSERPQLINHERLEKLFEGWE